ncbi:MAG: hypothetical protein Kow0020_09650 [Wenzhouxiangellaceae bacterium]
MRLSKIAAAAVLGLTGAKANATDWDFSGDLRVHLYSENWRDTRSGGTSNTAESGARLRLRAKRDLGEQCTFQTRLAATVADEGNDWNAYIRGHRDSGTAVAPGTATLDEFFFKCRTGASTWTVGRFQSNLKLPHMAGRSFDRNQASGINIGWTDAVSYRRDFGNGWYGELTAQYNGPDGNGQTLRGPLSFDDSSSRIGYFGVLGSDAEAGPVLMRALSLTVFPDSLAPDGTGAPARDDYLLAALKLGAGWDLGDSGRRLVAVGELAHAPNTPSKAAMRIPGNGDVDGWGWQLGTDLVNIFPKHTMGINYGQSDAGMLLSNDFRENNELFELRWQYKMSSALRFEFRYRWRRELERRIDAARLQRDQDVRLRFTYKF